MVSPVEEKPSGYVLITPIFNEAPNLESLRDTVLKQTIKPIIWAISDGGSEDGSFEMAREIFDGISWVYLVRQQHFSEPGYSHKNFALNVNSGYTFIKQLCYDNQINYSYIGKIDATTRLQPDYFEVLCRELQEAQDLAFVCGREQKSGSGTQTIGDEVASKITYTGINDIRLYRRDFLEMTNGYPVSYSPDSVLFVKALRAGLKVKVSAEACWTDLRPTGTTIGLWGGHLLIGASMYNLHYHPLLVLLNTLYHLPQFPYYQAFAVPCGYLRCLARGEKRLDDDDVTDYFRNKRIKEIFSSIVASWKPAACPPEK